MSDAKDQHEPSMEEILASIRRIISEDDEPGAGAPGEDVLVLTDEVDSEGSAVAAAPPPPSAAEASPAPRPAPFAESMPAFEVAAPESEPEAEAEPESLPSPSRAALDFGQRLISESTAAASLSAMNQLVGRSSRDPDSPGLRLGQADRTLEDLTRDLLRPMLKEWLDENLAQLVERIVREEIGRLALDAQRR